MREIPFLTRLALVAGLAVGSTSGCDTPKPQNPDTGNNNPGDGRATESVTTDPTPTLVESTPTNTVIEPTAQVENTAVSPLAVNPPYFEVQLPSTEVVTSTFDVVDAHAVYALYRKDVGPRTWDTDAEFVTAMETYLTQLKTQGVSLLEATKPGVTYSLLVKGNEILLDFNQNGALRDADPGRWSKESVSKWVDAGGPVSLYIGEDNHAYIARVDDQGNVTAYLNTLGASEANIENQWIDVAYGHADKLFDGKEWVSGVKTDGGIVFVENGAVRLSKDGIVSEVSNLSEVVFNTTADASRIVYELHKTEFDNQEQLHNDLFPGKLALDAWYKNAVDNSAVYDDEAGAKNIDIAGIAEEFVKVKSPINSVEFPVIGEMFINVFGSPYPVAVPLGAFEPNGTYRSLLQRGYRFSSDVGISNNYRSEEQIAFAGINWNQVQQLLSGTIVEFSTLYVLPPNLISDYKDVLSPKGEGEKVLSSEILTERQRLLTFQASVQSPAGFAYYSGENPDFQTGSMISALQQGTVLPDDAIFLPRLSYIKFIGK